VGFLQVIADVILIIAALLSLVAFASLAYAGLVIWRLVKDVKSEVTVVSDTAKESMNEVTGTVRFISESLVKPATVVAGYATAVRATVSALTHDATKKTRP
jgi:uncharacterized Tic20 family protein